MTITHYFVHNIFTLPGTPVSCCCCLSPSFFFFLSLQSKYTGLRVAHLVICDVQNAASFSLIAWNEDVFNAPQIDIPSVDFPNHSSTENGCRTVAVNVQP